ncbi:hypothetical protein PAQ31011_03042 [Pandoraea aquatica]|uniref:IPT/TIG domain-containing protein n=1 Tax=Pandoraea aquatica TaxID=2508290 RepID=A0A5E4W5I0_9BURK|nr:hypothetical protein [Pandoraea aquatica]VVE18854.1 hypothetical protein PAQ31011_03042 [Pandoraea aquatica]
MATITKVAVVKATCREGGEFEIWGSGFSGASEVYFVDAASTKIPVTSFTVVDDGTISCACSKFTQAGLARAYVVIGDEEASPVKNPPQSTSRSAEDQPVDYGRSATLRFGNLNEYTEYGNEFSVRSNSAQSSRG